MIERIQKRFALTKIGAKNLVKACISCTVSYLVIAMSIGVLYYFVCDVLNLWLKQSESLSIPISIIECIVVIVLIFLAHYIQYNMTFLNTYTESARLRISVAEKLRKFPLLFFSKRDLSDLTTTILSDVTGMEQALSHFIPEFVGSIISTTLLSLCMFFFDFKMALAAVWCVPVSFLLVVLAKKKLSQAGRKDRMIQLVRTEKIQEGLESIRDLKANHFTEKYLNEVDQAIDHCEKSQIRTELTNALFVVSSQLILKLGIATVVIAGVYLLEQNEINFEIFLLFLIVASRLYDPLNATLQNLAAIISCDPKIERLNEIENYPVQTGKETFEPSNYDIEFKNVSFSYQEGKEVLKDISFLAKQNEITALIGNSGGGKTTCASLAARFYEIPKGRITIGGIDISTIDPEVLLSKFSIVFQDVVLFNNSVLENIRIGKKDATDAEVKEAARLAFCDQFVDALPQGYETIIGENGSKLSGGQRQRISIARAILKNAPIVLLDEASASLDVESETYVQKALSRLLQNKTVIMIAHRMRTVANASHLVVLENGQVKEEGTPEQLIKQNGRYKHMVDLQKMSNEWKIG
ncbi:MAG TPA: ABC transporter ATP-binding protein [Candidatus Fimimorpha faecalis]|uniref:ABC transporter ATP-binding protein n=1 Tax=Candidatus Fimimorpha faecalis TaxID=2840824 RepID=A0A9D1EGD1_9FIRM|nr:ABC transporter ATP-binding protein [Candidatus Fimimorpha faecalis]